MFVTHDKDIAISAFVFVGALLVYLGFSGQFLLGINKDGAALTEPHRRIDTMLDVVDRADMPAGVKLEIAEAAQDPVRAADYRSELDAIDTVQSVLMSLSKQLKFELVMSADISDAIFMSPAPVSLPRPDFVLNAPGGKTAIVEVKARSSPNARMQIEQYLHATGAQLGIIAVAGQMEGLEDYSPGGPTRVILLRVGEARDFEQELFRALVESKFVID